MLIIPIVVLGLSGVTEDDAHSAGVLAVQS